MNWWIEILQNLVSLVRKLEYLDLWFIYESIKRNLCNIIQVFAKVEQSLFQDVDLSIFQEN